MRKNQMRYWWPQHEHRETKLRRRHAHNGRITDKQIEVLIDECEYADGPRVIVLMQQSCLSTGLREYLRELEALSRKYGFKSIDVQAPDRVVKIWRWF